MPSNPKVRKVDLISEPPPAEVGSTPLRPSSKEIIAIKEILSKPSAIEALSNLVEVKRFEEWIIENPYQKSHLYALAWYRGRLPVLGTSRFVSYVVSSRELARFVANSDLKIKLIDGSTAFADFPNRAIVLPQEAFVESSYHSSAFETPSAMRPAMISISNGMIIHEAAHFAQSHDTITASLASGMIWLKSHDSETWMKANAAEITGSRIAFIITNVVEDVYIENWIKSEFLAYEKFIETTHEFYFSAEEVLRRLSSCLSLITPSAKFSASGLIDLLMMAKNWRFMDAPFWGPKMEKLVSLMRSVRWLTDKDERAALAIKLTLMLLNDEQVQNDLIPNTIDDGVLTLFDTEGRAIKIDFRKMKIDGITEKLGSAINDAIDLDEARRRFLSKQDNEFFSIPPCGVMELPLATASIELDRRFESLGQRLLKDLTSNYVPGPAMKRGPVMVDTRLTRIVTDGKIFSHRQKRKAQGKDYEFVILVDCSGSMANVDKILEAMKAGFTAYVSLRTARCPVMLLGHSGQYDSADSRRERPMIYVIGKRNSSMDEVRSRASNLTGYARGGYMRNNYDGFAILKAAEIGYSTKPTKKIMFVISDGEPAGYGYSGDPAINHTKTCVDETRKKGIDIISITIEHGVIAVNNRIYGKGKNVATTSPLVLNELIRAMFEKHIH